MKQVTKYLFLFFIISIVSSHIYFKYLESNLTSEQIAKYESYMSSSKVIIMDEATLFTPKKIILMNFSHAIDISHLLFLSYLIVLFCVVYVLSKERKAKGHLTLFPIQDKYLSIYTIFVFTPFLMVIYNIIHYFLSGLIRRSYQILTGGKSHHYIYNYRFEIIDLITTTILVLITILLVRKIKRRKKEIRIGKKTWIVSVVLFFIGGVLLGAELIVSAMLGYYY